MNATANPLPTRNFWPHAIILWFVIFISALAAWITYAVHQKVDLVSPDYYEAEIHYQKQVDRLNRSVAVRGEVAVRYDAARQEITVQLPVAHVSARPTGTFHFYRPSQAALDVQIPLAIDGRGVQTIDTGKLPTGYWKLRLQWAAAGAEYYFEHALVLTTPNPATSPAPGAAK